jgi:hypothetical protein
MVLRRQLVKARIHMTRLNVAGECGLCGLCGWWRSHVAELEIFDNIDINE